jgi:SAM-dependent methyltransferase
VQESSSPARDRRRRGTKVSPPTPDIWSAFHLAEGFHLAHAVTTLHELDILRALAARPSTAAALAKRFRLDRSVLQGVLEYVAARTDVIRKNGATSRYGTEARFLIDLYMGAFAPNAIRLPDILRHARLGETVVDRARHARTFAAATATRERSVAAVIRSLELRHVLDLGCGSGDLLVQLATADRSFTGVGIEMNPQLCRAARARVGAARVTRQVRVIEGDSRRLGTLLPKSVGEQVTGVTACHVANEMFRSGSDMATAWLRGIRKTLPGRPVVINDYYGRLGTNTRGEDRHTLLHDYAQLISGQGIPPSTLRAWQAIYADAGYRLVHVLDDRATTQFIHLIV